MDDPVGSVVGKQLLTKASRAADAVAEKGLIGITSFAGQQPDSDERMRMVESDPQEFPVVPQYLHNVPGRRRGLDGRDLVAEHPQMAGDEPSFFTLAEQDGLFHETK
jgi:hypothetical protein